MKEPRDELLALSAALRDHLSREAVRGRVRLAFGEGEARTGVTPPSSGAQAKGAKTAPPPQPESPSAVLPPAVLPAREAGRGKKLSMIPVESEAADYGERMARLSALSAKAATCTLCGLCETRTQVVFARGRARNRVMFIGEAPGADEDAQGFPFVGRAGQLLDQILDAVGFDRDEIYVANILKCRPPNNRDPRPEETAACTPFLEEQIEQVDPKIICALGRHAAQFLTGKPGAPMGQLRGRIHYYRDRIPVLPTYHPAALLRNPDWKRVVWEDVQVLRREYLAL